MTEMKRLVSDFYEDIKEIVHRRERRQQTMLDAQRMSTKEEPYRPLLARLLRERGLGKIED